MSVMSVAVDDAGMSAPASADRWRAVADALHFAFQPIVNVHTGACQGYEALLRGNEQAGFPTIASVFDTAHRELALYRFDLMMREKAIRAFAAVPGSPRARLYYNLDNRLVEMADYSPGNTSALLAAAGLSEDSLCFEISERYEFKSYAQTRSMLTTYKRQSYRIALDDFGAGFSGLQMLYHCEPDFIKIDRFFIGGIERDVKKRMFVSHVISMAHLLGITVIGEGVETEHEFRLCREIGCDLVQGFLIQAPTADVAALLPRYDIVDRLNAGERRRQDSDESILADLIDHVEPVEVTAPMSEVCHRFKQAKDRTLLPVVDGRGEPVGIIREADIKEFTYSRYGLELLMNPGLKTTLRDLLTPAPVAEASSTVESILEMFILGARTDGIVVVSDGVYEGFLSATDLIRAMNEKNLQIARDQNPLTRLPGNGRIHEYTARMLAETDAEHVFAYFDFDGFKVFNDSYGFRLGDRVIVQFAEVLRHAVGGGDHFVGHIGGDDFFVGIRLDRRMRLSDAHALVRETVDRFNRDVVNFYNAEDRASGWVNGTDRDGALRMFPLLTVSAAVVHVPRAFDVRSLDDLGVEIAHAKKKAKSATDHLYCVSLECEDGDVIGPHRPVERTSVA